MVVSIWSRKAPFCCCVQPPFRVHISCLHLENQVSFSCDLGCVLAIVSPTLYCNDYGDELKITLPPICWALCVYWCLSAQSFACVCSLSQPGGVCKAEWCPIVCVCSSKSDGPSSIEVDWCSTLALRISFGAPTEEFVYEYLWIWLWASSGVQVYRKNSILKRNKKQVQVLSLQVSLQNFLDCYIWCMLMCGSVGCESLLRT